jgi:hypothetical protein
MHNAYFVLSDKTILTYESIVITLLMKLSPVIDITTFKKDME